jgi:uncharacterized protein (DUF58 family)
MALAARTSWRAPAVFAAAAVAAVAAALAVLVSRANLEVDLAAGAHRVVRGATVPVRVVVRNAGPRSSREVEVWLAGPGAPASLRVQPLRNGGSGEATVGLTGLPRGVHALGPARVVRHSPFGLITVIHDVECNAHVIVRPALVELPASQAPHGMPQATGGIVRSGDGTDFDWIRPWRVGDNVRRIHWLTTARKGAVMVRTFTDDTTAPTTVVLDVGPASYVDDDDFEAAVDVAATCCVVAVRSGSSTTLATTSGMAWRLAAHTGDEDALDLLAGVSRAADRTSAPMLDLPNVTCFVTGSAPGAETIVTEVRDRWRAAAVFGGERSVREVPDERTARPA